MDTSFTDDTRNKYALFCVQPAFDIIHSELNKTESIKHNVVWRCQAAHIARFGDMVYNVLPKWPFISVMLSHFENQII